MKKHSLSGAKTKKDKKYLSRMKGGAALLAALISISVAYSVSAPALSEREKESVPADPTHVYELDTVPETLEEILQTDPLDTDEEEKKKGFLYSIRAFLLNILALIGRFFRKVFRTLFSPKNIWALVVFLIGALIFILKEFYHITLSA
ncbi:MAG: hypothetical protein II971_03445 [Firmicutes bacterium]|nr:hypothetical protein [Bacillota bacterium]